MLTLAQKWSSGRESVPYSRKGEGTMKERHFKHIKKKSTDRKKKVETAGRNQENI